MTGSMVEPIQVVVAAVEPMLALGLRAACDAAEGLACVGVSTHATGLVGDCSSAAPHVLVAEPALLDPDRAATLAALGQLAVAVLLFGEDAADVGVLVRAGAAGLLSRAATTEELARAVRTAAAGGLVLQAAATRRLLDEDADQSATRLTPREREVLALVAQGRSNREIAAALFVGATTVKTHMEHVNDKLGTHRRTAAVTEAMRRGILPSPEGPEPRLGLVARAVPWPPRVQAVGPR